MRFFWRLLLVLGITIGCLLVSSNSIAQSTPLTVYQDDFSNVQNGDWGCILSNDLVYIDNTIFSSPSKSISIGVNNSITNHAICGHPKIKLPNEKYLMKFKMYIPSANNNLNNLKWIVFHFVQYPPTNDGLVYDAEIMYANTGKLDQSDCPTHSSQQQMWSYGRYTATGTNPVGHYCDLPNSQQTLPTDSWIPVEMEVDFRFKLWGYFKVNGQMMHNIIDQGIEVYPFTVWSTTTNIWESTLLAYEIYGNNNQNAKIYLDDIEVYKQDLISSNKPVTASQTHSSTQTNYLNDNNLNTNWNAGANALQWVTIDLQAPQNISAVKLYANQSTDGQTNHNIYAAGEDKQFRLVQNINTYTKTNGILEASFDPQLSNVRYVKVETTASPSWVSWKEIQVFNYSANPYPNTPAQSCEFTSYPTTSADKITTINYSGKGTSDVATVSAYIVRKDSGQITPLPPQLTEYYNKDIGANNYRYYYLVNSCDSNSGNICSQTANINLPAGKYIGLCNVTSSVKNCSGNPFCDYHMGTMSCSTNGWSDCKPYHSPYGDLVDFTVPEKVITPSPTPEVTPTPAATPTPSPTLADLKQKIGLYLETSGDEKINGFSFAKLISELK